MFYFVDSDMWLNNSERTYFCITTATVVTRTRHSVTLYVRCRVWFIDNCAVKFVSRKLSMLTSKQSVEQFIYYVCSTSEIRIPVYVHVLNRNIYFCGYYFLVTVNWNLRYKGVGK